MVAAANGDAFIAATNAGGLAVNAVAHADAETFANANALIVQAIRDVAVATAGAIASAAFTNAGTLDVGALASASGKSGHAVATIGTAMDQIAVGGTAVNNFANSGTVSFHATANAHGVDDIVPAVLAVASASVDGLHQTAVGTTAATNNYSNAATFSVVASANATGAAVNHAYATVSDVVNQQAVANAGDATNNLTNTGSLVGLATANATAARPPLPSRM